MVRNTLPRVAPPRAEGKSLRVFASTQYTARVVSLESVPKIPPGLGITIIFPISIAIIHD